MSGRKTAILVGCAAILAGLVASYSLAEPERGREERARAERPERGEVLRVELREPQERARDEQNERLERLERAVRELMEQLQARHTPRQPEGVRILGRTGAPSGNPMRGTANPAPRPGVPGAPAGPHTGWMQAQPKAPGGHPMLGMPMPGPRPDAANPIEKIEVMLEMIKRLQRICFDPGVAGMIAVGAMKDEVRRHPEVAIEQLEDSLKHVKTLGMRNAIRLTLKDMHKALGHEEQVVRHLRAMIEENDEAIQHHERMNRQRQERLRHDDGDDDDDDDDDDNDDDDDD